MGLIVGLPILLGTVLAIPLCPAAAETSAATGADEILGERAEDPGYSACGKTDARPDRILMMQALYRMFFYYYIRSQPHAVQNKFV